MNTMILCFIFDDLDNRYFERPRNVAMHLTEMYGSFSVNLIISGPRLIIGILPGVIISYTSSYPWQNLFFQRIIVSSSVARPRYVSDMISYTSITVLHYLKKKVGNGTVTRPVEAVKRNIFHMQWR